MKKSDASQLIKFDFNSAFDMVDVGIKDTALAWFHSYLFVFSVPKF